MFCPERIKGVEYLIVIAFCLGFIALWILVSMDKMGISKIVSFVIPLGHGRACTLAMFTFGRRLVSITHEGYWKYLNTP